MSKRVTYSTGGLTPRDLEPTSERAGSSKGVLQQLVSTRTFIQQLDVVVPLSESPSDLKNQLGNLTTNFHRGSWSLCDFLGFSRELEGKFCAVGLPGLDDDVWCLNGKGYLTISVSKETYQRLGIQGMGSLPWKECENTYVIVIVAWLMKKHVRAALEKWDAERGPWKVIYHYEASIPSALSRFVGEETVVKPTIRIHNAVHLPDFHVNPYPSAKEGDEAVESWNEEASALFEWIGMACLGSQRLRVNDNPDPYLAVYEPPEPSRIGSVVHLQWSGLLHPTLLSSIIDTLSRDESWPFAAICGHAVLTSPITYKGGFSFQHKRAPRDDSEDTWSLWMSRRDDDARWILAESVGKWDTRFS